MSNVSMLYYLLQTPGDDFEWIELKRPSRLLLHYNKVFQNTWK